MSKARNMTSGIYILSTVLLDTLNICLAFTVLLITLKYIEISLCVLFNLMICF